MDELTLTRWVESLADDLGVDPQLDLDTVLDLAGDAAHAVMRPAAPLTTFLVGIAVGRTQGDPMRTAAVLAQVRQSIQRWDAP